MRRRQPLDADDGTVVGPQHARRAAGDRVRIDDLGDKPRAQQGLPERCEGEQLARLVCVGERTNAEDVASAGERLGLPVPGREGEVAEQLTEPGRAVPFERREQQRVIQDLPTRRWLVGLVQPGVRSQDRGAGSGELGLVARGEVQHRQPNRPLAPGSQRRMQPVRDHLRRHASKHPVADGLAVQPEQAADQPHLRSLHASASDRT